MNVEGSPGNSWKDGKVLLMLQQAISGDLLKCRARELRWCMHRKSFSAIVWL